MTRKLILVCGLSATGKSRWCGYVLHLLYSRGENPKFFDIDEVREQTWGERARSLTAAEHRFKNEVTCFEVKKAFILGAEVVLLNMVMPTKRLHQQPFMEMVRDTERILNEIRVDRGQEIEPVKVKIDVRAIWCDCNEETARRRLAERAKGTHVSDLNDIKVWLDNKSWFEPPDEENYPYIWIDTSHESVAAEQIRVEQVSQFLFG